MRVVLIAGLALVMAGCATKRYPIATSLGAAEAGALTCRELEIELLRAEEVRRQISQTAEVDWRSVAGFLGDYGIGNAMAKNDADKAINARVASIRAAQVEKRCAGSPVSSLGSWLQGLP
jgi:hypothetical protein